MKSFATDLRFGFEVTMYIGKVIRKQELEKPPMWRFFFV